jgi:hypothetical protein
MYRLYRRTGGVEQNFGDLRKSQSDRQRAEALAQIVEALSRAKRKKKIDQVCILARRASMN